MHSPFACPLPSQVCHALPAGPRFRMCFQPRGHFLAQARPQTERLTWVSGPSAGMQTSAPACDAGKDCCGGWFMHMQVLAGLASTASAPASAPYWPALRVSTAPEASAHACALVLR